MLVSDRVGGKAMSFGHYSRLTLIPRLTDSNPMSAAASIVINGSMVRFVSYRIQGNRDAIKTGNSKSGTGCLISHT
jgi:hypothetical protein